LITEQQQGLFAESHNFSYPYCGHFGKAHLPSGFVNGFFNVVGQEFHKGANNARMTGLHFAMAADDVPATNTWNRE